jgi:DNA repair protein RecO (recombination protein O)
MEWKDSAIVLDKAEYTDSLTVISLLTKHHGLRKGTCNKRDLPAFTVGNIVSVGWRGRLEEHLGKFAVQSHENIYPFIYRDRYKVLALSSICGLFSICLNEKEKHEDLYNQLEDFMYVIKAQANNWLKCLVHLELALLSNAGFGLETHKCAVSGSTSGLTYLSPRSGKAVTSEVGEPYADKLFKLPKLFVDQSYTPSRSEVAEALRILQFFFERHVFHMKRGSIPAAREVLEQALTE